MNHAMYTGEFSVLGALQNNLLIFDVIYLLFYWSAVPKLRLGTTEAEHTINLIILQYPLWYSISHLIEASKTEFLDLTFSAWSKKYGLCRVKYFTYLSNFFNVLSFWCLVYRNERWITVYISIHLLGIKLQSTFIILRLRFAST